MAKLSIVIPSRDEQFLIPTIDDIFRNAKGDTEVVAVLDSSIWPAGWKEVTERHLRLHTLHNGQSLGMRASINRGFGSAMSRGADYVMKLDGHCSLSEGFDITLLSEIEDDWVVIPRRGRLDPENWCATDTHKPDIDYHYLSFPSDPNDFGGPGLNGKVWEERARERADILIDDEMSSQGSCWLTSVKNFERLELMDEAAFGPFWAEAQEVLMKNWLSGGRCVVNKSAKYLHLHKGRKYGRGYKLAESALVQGRNQAMKWIWNEAWPKQTLPFKWLIDHFWSVPSWPENWEEVLYTERKPRLINSALALSGGGELAIHQPPYTEGDVHVLLVPDFVGGLQIHSATYGVSGNLHGQSVDVTERVRSLVNGASLDIVVNNSTLTPNQNLFRGKKKRLLVRYSYDGGEVVDIARDEKDWLIIGQAQERELKHRVGYSGNRLQELETAELIRDREGKTIAVARELLQGGTVVEETVSLLTCEVCGRQTESLMEESNSRKKVCSDECGDKASEQPQRDIGSRETAELIANRDTRAQDVQVSIKVENHVPVQIHEVRRLIAPQSATALNDYLIRKFSISDRRLRAPMPIELPNFHRNDLAQLFAELGFKRGAEIGVAEGHYSEIVLKANPQLELLLLVDPWRKYDDNPRAHSQEHQDFSLNETKRKTSGYDCVKIVQDYSMNAVRDVEEGTLDWVYCDGNHKFEYIMSDLIEWSRRVRSGGLISGDDWFEMRWGGVVEAVSAYTSAMGIKTWYVFQGHKSCDFMWINP